MFKTILIAAISIVVTLMVCFALFLKWGERVMRR
jgi:hypothetical protein